MSRAPAAKPRPSSRRPRDHSIVQNAEPSPARWSWRGSTLGPALLSSALLWTSLPPLGLWPLAWIAPIPWLWLCRRDSLPSPRPWRALWLAGFLFWLAELHWLRLPHPTTSIGWLALSCYTAVYIPAFVWLTRTAVHRQRLSVLVAAPVVWTGLELARGHLLSGFTLASLGHTQYRWLALIQTADWAGAYGVSFVVMFVAAGLTRMLPCDRSRAAGWPLVPLAGGLALVLGYGEWRLATGETRPGPRIALIQGSIDIEMKSDPQMRDEIHREYFDLSRQAIEQSPGVDLVVWPETMFRDPLVTYDRDLMPPPDAQWTAADVERTAAHNRRLIEEAAQTLGAPLLLGIDVENVGHGRIDHYNSALQVARDGEILGRYDKMHPVMFGEYIPFGETIPSFYKITPLAAGLTAGAGPAALAVGPYRLAPNICFESVLPHLIRGQVAQLRRRGAEPDVLVNLTNDGWFWGSSELDLHLICGVFRAVECRKPFLIAANTGFSAHIDSAGRIVSQGPRRAKGIVTADVAIDRRTSPYSKWGDLPAGTCLFAVAGLAVSGCVDAFRRRRRGLAVRG